MSEAAQTLNILVYSDDANVRAEIISFLGTRPAPELPKVSFTEVATEPTVHKIMDQGGIDLAILDGEAAPAGGMGVCRQLKDEIFNCVPILVVTGRPADAWLATWCRADAVVPRPIDAVVMAEAVATLLRRRLVGVDG